MTVDFSKSARKELSDPLPDIVDMLRDWVWAKAPLPVDELCKRAANEIEQLRVWEKHAAEISKSMEFYRDLINKIGCMFGVEAYTSDDGSIQDEVLALKVPELVAKMFDDLGLAKAQRNDAERHLRELRTEHDELGKICDRAHDTSRKALDKLYACQERHERLKQYIYADAGMVMCSCSLIGKAGDPCPMCGKGPCPRLAAKREKILS